MIMITLEYTTIAILTTTTVINYKTNTKNINNSNNNAIDNPINKTVNHIISNC